MSRGEGPYLVLEAGGRRFGLAVDAVQAVLAYQEAAPMPQCPPGFLGGAVFHGEFLGLTPLAGRLDLPLALDPERAVIAVLSLGGGLVGVVAERSHGLLRPGPDDEEAHVLGRWEGPFGDRTVRVRGSEVHLLDAEAFLDSLARAVAQEGP